MAWTDKPTQAQANTLFNWLQWRLPLADAKSACQWAVENFDRKVMSLEMNRIKELYDSRKLNLNTAFSSDNWKGFEHSEKEEKMTPAEGAKIFGVEAYMKMLREQHRQK